MAQSTVISKEVLVPTVQRHVQLILSIPEAQTLRDILNHAKSEDKVENNRLNEIWESLSNVKETNPANPNHQFTIATP